MRAISMVRTSRTVTDATTSSRASFSLTVFRRISLIAMAGPPFAQRSTKWCATDPGPSQSVAGSISGAALRAGALPAGPHPGHESLSVPVVLDLEERKRAQDVRRVRGRCRMQISAVELG